MTVTKAAGRVVSNLLCTLDVVNPGKAGGVGQVQGLG
jgi:hypothetical protein